MNVKTNLIVITRDGNWYKMGDCSICAITDEEFKKLTEGNPTKDTNTIIEFSIKNITHREVGALL